MSELLFDRAGRRRSPATMPGFHAGRAPRNKGLRYPADPPRVEEIIAAMRAAGDSAHGGRLRGLIVILWRAGLRACCQAKRKRRERRRARCAPWRLCDWRRGDAACAALPLEPLSRRQDSLETSEAHQDHG
jgi:hypothetical protein